MMMESVWRPGVLACGCNIKVVCKSGQTLCLMLTKTWRIHSHWRSSPTWYTRSCTCSRGKLYISETKRRPKTRIKNGTQRCMHEAFHQQVSQTGASMDSESSHYMLLEQGKSAGLYSLSYWTGFEGGDVHPDVNWKQLNQPGWRLQDNGLLDISTKKFGGGTDRNHFDLALVTCILECAAIKVMHVVDSTQY